MPPIETDPLRFAEAVAQWGRGFLKPAYGACGRGVRAVAPGEALPAEVEGYVPGVAEPAFVQQAVAPPRGFAGVSVRALVQREEAGWVVVPMVARCSVTDPVVAVGRGAEAVPLSEAFPEAVAPSTALVLRCAGVLAGCTAPSGFVEVGFDLVLDEDHQPHLIEANSRPWGRLERLADGDGRWAKEHLEAALRPLRAVGRGLLSP